MVHTSWLVLQIVVEAKYILHERLISQGTLRRLPLPPKFQDLVLIFELGILFIQRKEKKREWYLVQNIK